MKPKRFRKQVPRTYLWCDDSVEKMFMLRYKSALAPRFESKNNYGKREAYVLAKMKSEWSLSKPSLASPTGNATKPPQPIHFDAMLEYWGDKIGYKRESLMSTDDISEGDSLQNSTGTSMPQQPQVQPALGTTLDNGLIAIKSQSDTMTQLLSHLVAEKGNKNE
ncbi:hypothetical protein H257_17270 [Aphanomyces astaci]|uniref:Uncharacterized protein n=1 Tax=Aphanomyces astaci TaxID=112090 RepID=W4FHK9_APHAT|nr:hypothetical protein H257_17270 [Aphanomyces astaci]ETV66228.1 hypothetical protein H257_17270 [Aphanomyces astaci]|eukprot:XP_009844297.1 hypothetical protein H257_17270 [Aphanomyces astaci]